MGSRFSGAAKESFAMGDLEAQRVEAGMFEAIGTASAKSSPGI